MNLHEYQAKALLKQYNIPAPGGEIAANIEEVVAAVKRVGLPCVVKAQVHAGGRGKAGGVKFVTKEEDAIAISKNLLGRNLVTYQTDARGQPVNLILISEPTDIDRELYLGAVVDRAHKRVVFMASTEGGVEIEKVAEEHPDKIHHVVIDPIVGVLPYQARELGFALDLNSNQLKQFVHMMTQFGKMFMECDLSMLEINPLVVRTDGNLTCLDAKITVDPNAMYRQSALRAMRDPSQEDERENRALNWELNYIALDGDIGCMVNGAGLAMATMDLIKLHGGNPANFLDVGGGATKERVTEAFKIILSDPNVKGILVNIFGGIVKCDMIAEGILSAVAEVGVSLPVVVRLEGNNAELAAKILNESSMGVIAAKSFDDAAHQIVKAVEAV